MGLSKKDLTKKKSLAKARLDELKARAKRDPLKKDKKLWQELEEARKEMKKYE
ncbi:MAG: hypothetical protein QW728_04060 [Thermoplasmata archaeon]